MILAIAVDMIELRLLIHTSRQHTRPVIAAFRALARWARAEPGCLSARLFLADGDPRCVCYVETWESEEAVRKMIRSPHFSRLAALMELGTEAPECQFRLIAETRGLEFPASVRSGLNEPRDPPPKTTTP
ncbi:putative quinol monooxygenase [Methylomagnum ishizawai]|uniref:putative quinol monooxygenase n=1 Tax=Methylomagnum ishizawai TaxID=1760988 RepID=UPI001C7E6B33|nr:antibiotic biosynthesis monooxygenase family protein [Methylomagnum ishizawai]